MGADEGLWDAAREARLIPPTLLIDVPDDAEITREEIFGPVLTIHPYDDLAEAIAFINDRPAALAAYWYGEDGDDFRRFLQDTTSGGVTRNDGLLHASLSNAPFGGVGGSGTGARRQGRLRRVHPPAHRGRPDRPPGVHRRDGRLRAAGSGTYSRDRPGHHRGRR
ncbi:aldehyde dehydrogenase family protein [Streptomyces sp. MA5143a]|uniref:aldehyde dehydrogenase family protein n=1 Tax=Streptomyces sp. MA5143a TaxID=2083010 RepID=UPI000D1B9C5C|nr:aldehyde dehydrogenase family protein [Streptomyces sp. MA5143a]